MLSIRLRQLRMVYNNLLLSSAQDIAGEFDRITYLLRIYDLILLSFNQCVMKTIKKEFQDDINEIEKEINKHVDRLIKIFINDLFGELIKFVKTYTTTDDENIKLGDEQDGEERKQNEVKPVENARLVENLCTDINFSWNKRTESFKIDIERIFQGTEVQKKILKKFMTVFVSYYGAFHKYLRSSAYSQQANQMIKVHDMMREIKKNYNV